jgi:GNAT superfamily N-acetyltransferase
MEQMPGPEIIIRTATAIDNMLLAEIGAQTFYDSFAAQNTPENMAAYLAGSFSPGIQEQELADPASRFLIAEMDGITVGYARLKTGEAPAVVPGQKPIEIVRFYARKPWIGRGVGAALMQACLYEAKTAGCDVIWLGVWEENPRAVAFYQKWGFNEVGKAVFQLGDDPQRDLLMARRIDQDRVQTAAPINEED